MMATEFIVGTICVDMKKINLENVIHSLERMKHRVSVPEDNKNKARTALISMLKVRKTENHDI